MPMSTMETGIHPESQPKDDADKLFGRHFTSFDELCALITGENIWIRGQNTSFGPELLIEMIRTAQREPTRQNIGLLPNPVDRRVEEILRDQEAGGLTRVGV